MKFIYLLSIATLLLISQRALATHNKQELPHIYYVNFQSQGTNGPVTISAQYRLPKNKQGSPVPAVVIAHNSAGVDSTGGWYVNGLNRLGIATLEFDMWSPRGLIGGASDRPQTVQETMPDAYAALNFLASKPEIDASNIGIIGFSWGGVVALLSATPQYDSLMRIGEHKFAAHIAHYPVCWAYNFLPGFEFSQLIGSPVLIQVGAKDDYEPSPNSCKNLVNGLPDTAKSLVQLNTYNGAHHAWDRLEKRLRVFDIFGNGGQGSEIDLIPNRGIAIKSRKAVNQFFKKHLLE